MSSTSRQVRANVSVVLAGADFYDGHIRIVVGDSDNIPTAVCLGDHVSVIAGHDCTDTQFAELFERVATELRRKVHERDHNAVAVPHASIGGTS